MKGTIVVGVALLLVAGLAQDSIVASRPSSLGPRSWSVPSPSSFVRRLEPRWTRDQARTRDQRTDEEPGTKDQGLTAVATGPQAVVDRYCVTCHNPRMRAGGLALDALPVSSAEREPHTWEKVVRKVRTGMMPPSGAPRPDRATLDAFAATVEHALDRAAAAAPNPGAPALHRLNRTEYGNAVRDLLDLPIDTAALLPGDDSSEGFDNLASVLSVSPALMQAYVTAAAKISRLAVGDPTISAELTTYTARRGMSQAVHHEGLPLGTRGGMVVRHIFPLDAEYELRVGRAGGGLFGLPAVGTDDSIEITLNGERAQLLGRDARGGVRLHVPAGPQTIGVAVVRRANARGVDDLFSELASTAGVGNLAINGPLNPTGPGDTPSRRKIFTCLPPSRSALRRDEPGSDTGGATAEESTCARTILSRLARHALRRPVGEGDAVLATLMEFFDSGRKLRGFESGIQYALARLLVDPQFIYRFERAHSNLRAGAVYRISDLELASRLSFFLWSSIPDEPLLEVAAAGRLSDPTVLEAQTRRLLADDRARALVDNLAGQWLQLRQLEDITPGTKEFDGNLRYAFRRETELLFETIVHEDRSILDLIDADYTFVDERLARHYGIPYVRGSRFRRVTLDEGARRGLLGHGSLLTVTSAGNRTSPVKRGKWILENLLGAPVPLPPPGVETNLTESTAAGASPTSVRQRLEQHRSNPSCASCHAVMDPVGFSLEHFDLIGKYRDQDGGVPVDARGRLADGTALDGPGSLRTALLDRRDAVASTATEKLLTYALGRQIEYFDMPAVRAIVRDAANQDFRFSSLITGIVKSTPFQMKRYEGGTAP
jgi:mono/diheme cytochrome c family protein